MKPGDEIPIFLALLRGEPVSGLSAGIWQALAELARRHNLGALLYWRLQSMRLFAEIPQAVAAELRLEYLGTAQRNVRLYHQLGGLIGEFNVAGIPTILLKGAYLAEQIYGNVAVRPMEDVDLLLEAGDLSLVTDIMQRADFHRTDHLNAIIQEAHHFSWRSARTGLNVETHWGLIDDVYGVRVDAAGLWDRSSSAKTMDISVRQLAPEDQVLHLCIHAPVHEFVMGLRVMCDLDATVRFYHGHLDWESMRQRARLWNADRCMYICLSLATELLDTRVPEGWLDAVRPADLEPRYLVLARECILAGQQLNEQAMPYASNVAGFWATKGLVPKLALLKTGLFPSRQVMAKDYAAPPGSARILLYYPARLRDLLRRHGEAAWRFYRGDEDMQSRAQRQQEINVLRNWLLYA